MRTTAFVGVFVSVCVMTGRAAPVRAEAFTEPPAFTSSGGLLDILMVAKAKPVSSIVFQPPGGGAAINPTGWVYEICYRKDAIGNKCPDNPALTSSEYGGIRLALQKGDLLKVRLVNQLPKQDRLKVSNYWNPYASAVPDKAGINLPLTPTNLHTHGLVVEARAPSWRNPTWGDDIFVDLYNPANGLPVPQGHHQHGASVVKGFLDYQIYIPKNEPSGADWFHPHVHGITADSLSSGLAGIISIGKAADYASSFPEERVRHLILKDMQVLAQGAIQFTQGTKTSLLPVKNGDVLDDEQDPAFCSQQPKGPAELREGSCPGVDNSPSGGSNYSGGRWYFSVSGRVFPTLDMNRPDGEIWRLSNVGASATYKIQLSSNSNPSYGMLMQLVSVDGVSIHVANGTPIQDIQNMGGNKFTVVPCPAETPKPPHASSAPVCISDFVMMPGSRAEVWVAYRDKNGHIIQPPPGASATLKTVGFTTGAPGVGDPWPAVDLAKVTFSYKNKPSPLLALALAGDALAANRPEGIFYEPVPYAKPAPLPKGCAPVPMGYHRRIYFGLVNVKNSNVFGLGYELVDASGRVVPGSTHPVTAFDPSGDFICLPLGPGQKPVHETWELVNLATENHNYHIHQTKFWTLQSTLKHGPGTPDNHSADTAGIMEDNVPLAVAEPVGASFSKRVANKQNGYCTIEQWKTGKCAMKPAIVDIPFSQLGEFVYHCHILEHEDSGMMAKIQVVPSPR